MIIKITNESRDKMINDSSNRVEQVVQSFWESVKKLENGF